MFQKEIQPLHGGLLILFCSIYLLAGLIGHDPWKVEDATHLGIAWEFASHGDWLNPRIGFEPWLGGPPLYHWCAALTGKAFGVVLPFHDAARLSSAIFGALLLFALSLAARRLAGRTEGWQTPLLAVGTLGLLLPIHDAQPAIALIAAQAFVYAGIAALPQHAFKGALVAGMALGIGVLCAGLQGLSALLPPFLFPLLHRDWRTPRVIFAAALALLLGTALGSVWWTLLAWQAPELLPAVWKAELTRLDVYTGPDSIKHHLELLAWFAWPVLPLSIWSLWSKRHALSEPAVLLPLIGSVIGVTAFFLLADPKPLQALPLVVPLTLLALPGAERLRRGAANAFDWFGVMTFTLMAGLLWLGGIAMATGLPVRTARNFYKAEPGFVGHLSIPAFAVAALLTLTWIWILVKLPRSPWRGTTRWAAGLTLMWGLIAAMWLPWIDFGKTYRPVATSLDRALGESHECVASKDVGIAQKASLRYFTGLATKPIESSDTDCPLLLIQGASGKEPELNGMRKVWEGNRGGDKSERLRLYRRG